MKSRTFSSLIEHTYNIFVEGKTETGHAPGRFDTEVGEIVTADACREGRILYRDKTVFTEHVNL